MFDANLISPTAAAVILPISRVMIAASSPGAVPRQDLYPAPARASTSLISASVAVGYSFSSLPVAGFTTWYIVTAASIEITSQYPLHAKPRVPARPGWPEQHEHRSKYSRSPSTPAARPALSGPSPGCDRPCRPVSTEPY